MSKGIKVSGFSSEGNSGSGIYAGPNSRDLTIINCRADGNAGAGILIDSRASGVNIVGGGASHNGGGGLVIDHFHSLLDDFPVLKEVDKDILLEAAKVVGESDEENRVNALSKTKLFAKLGSVRFIEWAQLATGLFQVYQGFNK